MGTTECQLLNMVKDVRAVADMYTLFPAVAVQQVVKMSEEKERVEVER